MKDINIYISNSETINSDYLSINMTDAMTPLLDSINEIMKAVKPLLTMIKQSIETLKKAMVEFLRFINTIDVSSLVNIYPFVNSITVDRSRIETIKYQTPNKVIEDEDSLLSLSYSLVYAPSNSFNKSDTDISNTNQSENGIKKVCKVIKQKIKSFLNVKFLTETIISSGITYFLDSILGNNSGPIIVITIIAILVFICCKED